MKQILITGAFGFVGSRLALHFLRQGWRVHLFDLPNHPLKQAYLSEFSAVGAPLLFEGDITDAAALEAAIHGCEEVIHSAALLNSVAPWAEFRRVNVEGTKTVCEAAIRCGVGHLTLISTSDVFGIPPPGTILDEGQPFTRWQEPYADTKIEAAEYVMACRERHRLNASIVFPGWVYGEGDRQFFPAVMDMVRDRWVFTWHKGIPGSIYFIHVNDLVSGVDRLIHSEQAKGSDYLLLEDNTGITPLDLYRLIAAAMKVPITHVHIPYPIMMVVAKLSQWWVQRGHGSKPLLSTTDVKAFGNAFRFSTRKAQQALGWQPAVPIVQGLQDAVAWQLARSGDRKV